MLVVLNNVEKLYLQSHVWIFFEVLQHCLIQKQQLCVNIRVVSSGSFNAFHAVFFPMEYILSVPRHSTYVTKMRALTQKYIVGALYFETNPNH